MGSGEPVPGSVYFYAPNKGAPVFFAVAFAASGFFHIYQCIRYNSWRLTGIYVVCSVFFTGGFIVRPLLELSNYLILGRILYYAPYYSPIHPGRVITTFSFISVVVEALNGNGVALSANQSLAASKLAIGRALLKAALLIQLAVLGLRNPNLLAALYTLYASTTLLTIRTVFRVAEFWTLSQHDFYRPGGIDPSTLSPAIRYEWFFWVFEAVLMLGNHVLLNVRHPRRYLPKSAKTYLSKGDGVTEVLGKGYEDGRRFWVTVVDPFDLWGW
ncbi:hypothetical protein N0V88_006151 [Collariella sp. IMI 366227]|nr:hypothetical protein N0V88_006151 [Collariella sp. IMI 366227]